MSGLPFALPLAPVTGTGNCLVGAILGRFADRKDCSSGGSS